MKRGEVWWATLQSPLGRRPVLVIQSDTFNESRIGSVIVALVTSNLAVEGAPGNVRLPQGEAGLQKASVVNVSQLYTIERRALTGRLGVLTAALQQRVDAGLRLVLALPGSAVRGVMEPAAEYAVREIGGAREDIHDVAAKLRKRVGGRGLPRGPSAEELIREDRDDPDR